MCAKYLPWDVKTSCGGENGVCVNHLSDLNAGDSLHCDAPPGCDDPFVVEFSKCDWASALPGLATKNMALYTCFVHCVREALSSFETRATLSKLFDQCRIVFKAKVEVLYPPATSKAVYVIPGAKQLQTQYSTIKYAFDEIKKARVYDRAVPVTALERTMDSIDAALKGTPTVKASGEDVSNLKQNLVNAVAGHTGRTSDASPSSSSTDVPLMPPSSYSTPAGNKRHSKGVVSSESTDVKRYRAAESTNMAHDIMKATVGVIQNLSKQGEEKRAETDDFAKAEEAAKKASKVVAMLTALDVSELTEEELVQHQEKLRGAKRNAVALTHALLNLDDTV
jgi:hypothetical protein